MTESSKILLEKYQIRKSRKQKKEFTEWLITYLKNSGFNINVEKGKSAAKNIIIGNPETAKVVYTAHYDTCAVLPFPNFITPKSITCYLLFQLALTIFLFLPIVIIAPFADLKYFPLLMYAYLLILVYALMFGKANKHTANDNTSGVATIIDIITKCPDELKKDVAFILFDFEELGLIGSASYYKKHKKIMKNKLLINFDCVSDGNNILFAIRKKAANYANIIEKAFYSSDKLFNVEVATKGVFYPSDQQNYPLGVGVAALNKTKGGLLYMDKIHTKKDVVFEEKNIDFLSTGAINLIKEL